MAKTAIENIREVDEKINCIGQEISRIENEKHSFGKPDQKKIFDELEKKLIHLRSRKEELQKEKSSLIQKL